VFATTRRRRSVRSVTAFAAIAAAALTSNAHAASTSPGDFSSYIAGNPSIAYVDNCTVELGPVVDTIAFPNYRKLGGVRVNCGSVHSVIKATVWEQYWNGSGWVNWGNSTVGTRYNQSGSGYGLSGILRSPAYCGPYHYYWRTAALVQTERIGGYRYSASALDSAGC
jgi:hypothetical protein